MSAALKTKFYPVNDEAPQPASAALRATKPTARIIPLVRLRPPRKKSVHWAAPVTAGMALILGVAMFWYADKVLEVIKLPDPAEPVAVVKPDLELPPAYAETVTPPLSNVIAPIPVVPALPEDLVAEAATAAAKDPTSGIVLPASSLQAGYPGATQEANTDASVAIVADKIKDAPVLANVPVQDNTAHITVQKAQAPSSGNLLAKAQEAVDSDDSEGAVAIYDRIIAHDHADRAALKGKGEALKNLGQYEAAATVYRRLLVLDPKDDMVRVNLASMLGLWGAPEASEELRRMVAVRPTFAPAQAALAEALVAQNNALAALPHAWRALQIEPNNILYRLNLAIAYDRLGRSGDALEFYREALKAYSADEANSPDLPVSMPEIQDRVSYLETLMDSAEKLAPAQ